MLAHRELTPRGESRGDVLLMHGFPESSYMWRDLMPALVGDGWRAVAPDLPGFGDSPPDPPGTWERKIEAVERFRAEAGLEQFVLVVHDWGGLIGLRWVCEQAGHRVRALVISGTGFFPDGKWHGMAEGLRASGTGEELVGSITREGFAAVMRQISPEIGETALDEYWACFGDEPHQQSVLELYRSGDFSKLVPYEGCLAALDVPTLLLWGEGDGFAPPVSGRRFAEEIPGAKLVVLPNAGHFVFEDQPERCAEEVVGFLAGIK